jgi:hypothetical protein
MIDMFKEFFKNETVKKVIKNTGVLAGAIVIEGIKGVAIKSATKGITTAIDGGVDGVKNLTLEDWVGRGKKKNKSIDVPNVKSHKEKVKIEVEGDFVTVKTDKDEQDQD